MLIIGLPVSATPNQEMSCICVKNRQNGGWSSKKTLHVPPSLHGADSCAERKVIWRTDLEVDLELLRGVIGPIFTLNDYLNTVFDNVVGLRGSCKIILPLEKFDLKIFDHVVSLKTLIALSRSPNEKVSNVLMRTTAVSSSFIFQHLSRDILLKEDHTQAL